MKLRRSRSPSEVLPAWLRLLGFGLPLLAVAVWFGAQFFGLDALGWNNGFNHPLAGWDHLLAMLAVGIWAAQLRGHAVWMLPLAFVGVMSLGGLAGAAGITIPSVEGIILLSCAVFALLITRKIRFSGKINVLIVAFFAFFHGFAHGQEISTSASLISYTLGFMLATLLLHGAGILVAKLVVLAATFLLTAMFSQSVWAKAGPTETAEPAASTHLQADAGFYSANLAGYGGDWDLAGENSHSAAANSSAKAALAKPPAGFAGAGAESVAACVLPVLDCFAVALADMARNCLSGFKQRFPDINQTPGTQLLSSGVGRTSPPLSVSASPAPISLAFRSTPSVSAESIQQIRAESFGAAPDTRIFYRLHATAFCAAGNGLARYCLGAGRSRSFAASKTAFHIQSGSRPVFITTTTATIFAL
ncbi:HupE/UreJ family protein [Methylomonas koyamae]|uniref:HupE/UreJ family protein n=1 Tax=Methylomonas koyamae TaxID=702114 RepID=UPI001127FAD3|nr:HupE/UreJ family protein [Methylomonas koyamae]TPQ29450.1 hypothetical protein C2U68_01450 [Methylomonas koyamae]